MSARKSFEMRSQIEFLHKKGFPIKKIARSLGVSRNTVRKYLGNKPVDPIIADIAWENTVDWEYIKKELNSGSTYKVLYQELQPKASMTTFWRICQEKNLVPPNVTMRLEHKPGDRMYFDFADGVMLTDPQTGKQIPTQFFVATLPFSSKMYGEFVMNQKLPTLIGVLERAFAYFGGVTPYVVNDNLKAGVTKAHRYDPDVNRSFCDFANHCGFAVIPARPYAPKDKANVECNIGVNQRDYFQIVRHQKFYSLSKLNYHFWDYLEALNNQVMKDYGLSRNERFEKEKPLLKPLPATRYEIGIWKSAKVHPDCHIQIERNFYSVPYTNVGKVVRVRIGHIIEVFSEDGELLTAHQKLNGKHQYGTHDVHYPEPKLAVARFEIHHAKSKAKKIGTHTEKLVEHLLNISHPYRYLRRIQGILRLIDSGSIVATSLEFACEQGLVNNKLRLQFIKDCAEFHQLNGARPILTTPKRDIREVHLRQIKPQEESPC
jgi:transposase